VALLSVHIKKYNTRSVLHLVALNFTVFMQDLYILKPHVVNAKTESFWLEFDGNVQRVITYHCAPNVMVLTSILCHMSSFDMIGHFPLGSCTPVTFTSVGLSCFLNEKYLNGII